MDVYYPVDTVLLKGSKVTLDEEGEVNEKPAIVTLPKQGIRGGVMVRSDTIYDALVTCHLARVARKGQKKT